MQEDNLIDADSTSGKYATAAAANPVKLAPLALPTPPPASSASAFPPLPVRAGDGKSASSEESEIMKSRLELAEMAISRQRARKAAETAGGENTASAPSSSKSNPQQEVGVGRAVVRDSDDVSTLSNATTKEDLQSVSEKSTGSVTSDTKDDDERKKEEEKQAARARRKAEKEAKAAQEAREEEERRLRREEKLRDMEEAKKLKELEAQLRAERDREKAEIEVKNGHVCRCTVFLGLTVVIVLFYKCFIIYVCSRQRRKLRSLWQQQHWRKRWNSVELRKRNGKRQRRRQDCKPLKTNSLKRRRKRWRIFGHRNSNYL